MKGVVLCVAPMGLGRQATSCEGHQHQWSDQSDSAARLIGWAGYNGPEWTVKRSGGQSTRTTHLKPQIEPDATENLALSLILKLRTKPSDAIKGRKPLPLPCQTRARAFAGLVQSNAACG